MDPDFDPYHEWLQIPADRQPPSAWDLLGLAHEVATPEKVRAAALARSAKVRKYCLGPRGAIATRILGELATAKNTISEQIETRADSRSEQTLHDGLPAAPETPAVAQVAADLPQDASGPVAVADEILDAELASRASTAACVGAAVRLIAGWRRALQHQVPIVAVRIRAAFGHMTPALREQLRIFAARIRAALVVLGRLPGALGRQLLITDRKVQSLLGEENRILHQFVRMLLIIAVFAGVPSICATTYRSTLHRSQIEQLHKHAVVSPSESRQATSPLVTADLNRAQIHAAAPVASPAVMPAPAVKQFPCQIEARFRNDWSIEGGELVQNSVRAWPSMKFGNASWSDYDFSVEIKKLAGNDVVVLEIGQGSANASFFYGLGAYNNTQHDTGFSRPGQKLVYRGRRRAFLSQGRWYRAEVRVRGSQCECFLDGEKLFAFTADGVIKGPLGLSANRTSYRFRNILIKRADGTVLLEGLPDLEHAGRP